MAKTKFEPIRLCVACRKKNEKKNLIRIVKAKDEQARLDCSQKSSGRGVYVCYSEDCFKILKKKRGLERGLRCAVSEEVYFDVENKIKGS